MRGGPDLTAPRVGQGEIMKGWKSKSQKENPGTMKSILAQLPSFFLGILGAVIIPLILDRCSITDSRLVHAGPPPLAPTVIGTKVLPDGMAEYHVKNGVRLKNYGWRRGHVDKIELARYGLSEYPEKVTVLRVDKTDLGWLEEKTVEFEFITLLKPFSEKTKTLIFRTTYYGPTGSEIYTEMTRVVGERIGP